MHNTAGHGPELQQLGWVVMYIIVCNAKYDDMGREGGYTPT